LTEFVHRFEPGGSTFGTLALLHGTGGNESSLMKFAAEAAPGWSRLGIRGRSLEEGVPRYFRRLSEGVLDEADIRKRADELAEFLESVDRKHGYRSGRLMAMGYSNGANMAAALMLLHPDALAGAVLLRPMSPFREPPLSKLHGKRVLILAGERDLICPPSESERLRDALAVAGAQVTLKRVVAGHELSVEDAPHVKGWIGEARALG
jgi:phospholipase/carboxylesterase